MMLVAIGRWMLYAGGIDIGAVPSTGAYEIPRAINAGATLSVAVAMVIGTWRWFHDRISPKHLPYVILGMLLVVLFAQNRSVWVVSMVMSLIIFLGTRTRLWLRASVGLFVLGSIVLLELVGPGHTSDIGESLSHAASNTSTWDWRLERWHNVWATHAARGPLAILFGSGYGHAWVSGAVGVWEVSPHNGFIQIAVRIGLVGALLLFGTYAAVLLRLGRVKNDTNRLLQILTIGVLVYFIPYSESIFSGLLLGFAVARTLSRTRVQVAARASAGLRARPALRAQPPR